MLIDAVPAVVWPIVCDIQTPADFSSEFQGGEWLDGASEAALGARFRSRSAFGLTTRRAAAGQFDRRLRGRGAPL